MSEKHLSESDVRRIAELAHIEVTDERVTETGQGLEKVLDFVDQLQAANTEGIEPTSQVTGLVDVLREDIVKPSSVSPQTLLDQAPDQEAGYIKVKRVLK